MVATFWQQNSIEGLFTIIMALIANFGVWSEKSCLWKLKKLMLSKITQHPNTKRWVTPPPCSDSTCVLGVLRNVDSRAQCVVSTSVQTVPHAAPAQNTWCLPPAILIILCRWDEKRWFQSFQWENFISYIPQSAGLTNIQGFPYPYPPQHKWLC